MGMAMIIFLKLCLVFFLIVCSTIQNLCGKLYLRTFIYCIICKPMEWKIEECLGDRLRINDCCNVLLSFLVKNSESPLSACHSIMLRGLCTIFLVVDNKPPLFQIFHNFACFHCHHNTMISATVNS